MISCTVIKKYKIAPYLGGGTLKDFFLYET